MIAAAEQISTGWAIAAVLGYAALLAALIAFMLWATR